MFTREEFDSALQAKWSAHFAKRIDELRRQNDSPQNSEQTTATLRGRIAELKELLRLAEKPAPAQEDGPE